MTLKFGLLGEKLGHSLSPQIHAELYRLLGLDASYELFEIPRGGLHARFAKLRRVCAGLNVTIPYKLDVISELTETDAAVKAIGACNTIKFSGCGAKAQGFNTDYFGFKRLLGHYKIKIKNKAVVVLGTGGAARAVLRCVRDLGAGNVMLVTRQVESAPQDLRAEYTDATKDLSDAQTGLGLCTYAELPRVRGDVIINCTPVGMYPRTGVSPVSAEILRGYTDAVDVVYNPAETEFLRLARQKGLNAANGLFMLAAQAIASEEIWLGRELGDDIIEAIAAHLAAEQKK